MELPEGFTARDLEVLKREHRFLPDEDDDGDEKKRRDKVTVNYEQQLFRDFVIADLSRAHERMVGLRWRTAEEVRAGKGDSVCAAKGCHVRADLAALELLFAFEEGGERKKTLVTCVLCPEHAELARFAKSDPAEEEKRRKEEKRALKEKKKQKKKQKKEEERRKRERDEQDLW